MKNKKGFGKSILIAYIMVLFLVFEFSLIYMASANEPEWAARYLVTFEKGAKKAAKDAIKSNFGSALKNELQLVDAALVILPSAADVHKLKKLPGIKSVVQDAIFIESTAKPPPPSKEQLPWGVDRIDADKVWSANRGTGIRVAVLDSGIDIDHPDLAANIKGGINTVGTGDPNANYNDGEGHGTMIAGIIAAIDNDKGVIGVAPEAWLYAARFRVMGYIPAPGDQFNAWLSDLLEAMEWCVQSGMQVINMSFSVWSVKYDANGNIVKDKPLHDPTFYSLIQQAYAANIVQVAAVTNDSARVEEVPEGIDPGTIIDTTPYRFPASYRQVIGASATGKSGKRDTFASFSNFGSVVDLAAPGASILSTDLSPDGIQCTTGTGSGTSYACPHVVGTAALVLKKYGSLTAEEVKARLKSTAENIGLTPDQQGAGLVDAEAAAPPASLGPSRYGISPVDKLSISWGEIKGK